MGKGFNFGASDVQVNRGSGIRSSHPFADGRDEGIAFFVGFRNALLIEAGAFLALALIFGWI